MLYQVDYKVLFCRKYAAVPVQLEIVILQYEVHWLVCTYNIGFFLQSIQLLLPVSDGQFWLVHHASLDTR